MASTHDFKACPSAAEGAEIAFSLSSWARTRRTARVRLEGSAVDLSLAPSNETLVPDSRQQLLNFRFLVGRQRQQRQPRLAAIHPVEVHRVLDARNAELADDPHRSLGDALLLFTGEIDVALFPRRIDLVAGSWSTISESQNRS